VHDVFASPWQPSPFVWLVCSLLGHPRFCFPPYSSGPCLMPVLIPGQFFISNSFCVAATTRVMLYRTTLLAVSRVLMPQHNVFHNVFLDPFPSSCMLCGVGLCFLFLLFATHKKGNLACQFISMLYTFQNQQLSPLLVQWWFEAC